MIQTNYTPTSEDSSTSPVVLKESQRITIEARNNYSIPENNYFIPVKLQLMQETRLNSGEYKIESVTERLERMHRKQSN